MNDYNSKMANTIEGPCAAKCVAEKADKHEVLFNSTCRLEYTVKSLESLLNRIKGTPSDTPGDNVKSQVPTLSDVLSGSYDHLDRINEKLNILIDKLSEELFG